MRSRPGSSPRGPDYTLEVGSSPSTASRCRSPVTWRDRAPSPGEPEKAIDGSFADGWPALPGLGRKLPAYGKYSFLGSRGDEPANVPEGAVDRPPIPPAAWTCGRTRKGPPVAALSLSGAKALAELPPVFSQKALLERVAWLSAPSGEGRGGRHEGPGIGGRVHIAAAFESMGLQPGG